MAFLKQLRALYLPVSVLALSACAEDRTFRVSSVGSAGAAEMAANSAGESSGSGPIVASGNVLVGGAAQSGSAGWLVAAMGSGGTLTGSISTVLLDTSQTVVQLDNGTAFLLQGTGASVGDAVSINLASGQVVAGPQALVGTQVIATTTSTAGTLSSGATTAVLGTTGSSAGSQLLPTQQTLSTGSATSPVTGTVTGLLTRCC